MEWEPSGGKGKSSLMRVSCAGVCCRSFGFAGGPPTTGGKFSGVSGASGNSSAGLMRLVRGIRFGVGGASKECQH